MPAALALLLVGDLPGAPLSPADRTATGVAVAATAALLWWRRAAPVAVLAGIAGILVLVTALTGDTGGTDFAAVLALYAVAAYRSSTTAWLAFGGLAVVLSATFWFWLDATGGGTMTIEVDDGTVSQLSPLQAFWIAVSSGILLGVVAVALGISARSRRLHVEALVERTSRLALERDQGEQLALVAERTRIAREMHDVVAHSLSVMVALSDGAAASLDRNPAQAREALTQLSETGRSALADTRRVLGVLRDEDGTGPATAAAPLAPQPTTPDLTDLLGRYRAAGLPVRLLESGPPLPPDAGLRLAVYRIVQEALTNVLRHAPGSPRIDVALHRSPGQVEITVENDAGAGGHAAGGGRGIIGMRERAAVYDGEVHAGPTPDGWRLRAVLRWREADA